MALGLMPNRALLNDINPHVINFYRWCAPGAETTVVTENDRSIYDANRRRFNQLIATRQSDTAEAAHLFYYLNHTCFNGLTRFNMKGQFNVPFGEYRPDHLSLGL